jgi:hypothetical protein
MGYNKTGSDGTADGGFSDAGIGFTQNQPESIPTFSNVEIGGGRLPEKTENVFSEKERQRSGSSFAQRAKAMSAVCRDAAARRSTISY